MRYIFLLFLALCSTSFAAGKIQDADVKSLTEVGSVAARLINTTKIYDTTNSQQLSTTIAGLGSSGALTKSVTQSSHGFSVGDVLYYTGSAYAKAKADAASTSDVVGVVSAVADANNFTLMGGGYITTFSGLTAGTTYFLSPTTAGAVTTTEPTTTGQISLPLLTALSTTSGYVMRSRGMVVTGASTGVRSEVWVYDATGANGSGSTNTNVRIFNTVGINTGTGITYATSASLGDTFTINETGVYSVYYRDVTTGTSTFCITKNATGTMLTSSANSNYGSNPNVYVSCSSAGANMGSQSLTLNLTAGDIIRAQISSSPTGGNNQGAFRITKVAN